MKQFPETWIITTHYKMVNTSMILGYLFFKFFANFLKLLKPKNELSWRLISALPRIHPYIQ